MDECIFCKITKKEVQSNIIYENGQVVAFADINPSADVHILIVPKEHIASVRDINENHGPLLVKIYQAANELVEKNSLGSQAYRVVVNGGKAQHIAHLHFHLLGGQLKKMV